MTKDFISLNLDVTVSETVEILKEMKPDEEEMYYIYITDNEDRIKRSNIFKKFNLESWK